MTNIISKSGILCIMWLVFLMSIPLMAQERRALLDASVTGGDFLHAQQKDLEWVRSMDPDRFLAGFRIECGMGSSVPRYGGWEEGGASGHAFGHWLSASSRLCHETGDPVLFEKVKICVDGLAECQKFEDTGLLAAFPESRRIFSEIRKGDIRAQGFDLNGGWVPLYTEHKVLAGLYDVCRYSSMSGRQESRELFLSAWPVLVKLADYFENLFSSLSDEQLQTVLITEHGGLQEVYLNLYSMCGNPKYLKLAKRLEHRAFLEPLERGEDRLEGEHANMEIPKVIGLAREFELTGDNNCLETSRFFWDRVVRHHSYAIGGNSDHEHFGRPDHLEDRLDDATCETCNTYNMLKLTRLLYRNEPRIGYVDYYERALFNQILGSQNPADGMVCYMSPLGDGCRKTFSLPFDSFWCCVGSGMENHAGYGKFIYAGDKDNLYVNLYIPSRLSDTTSFWVEQTTGFPFSDMVEVTVHPRGQKESTIHLRHPEWSDGLMEVRLNGRKCKYSEKDGYVAISRKWKEGDKISVSLNPSIRSEALLGDSSRRAFLYGPLVLACRVDGGATCPEVGQDVLPVLVDKDKLRFTIMTKNGSAVDLYPYYKETDHATVVYFK